MTTTLSTKGLAFLQTSSHVLAVDDMATGGEIVSKAIEKRIAQNKPLDADFGKHLLWLVGVDALLRDRAEVRRFVEKLA